MKAVPSVCMQMLIFPSETYVRVSRWNLGNPSHASMCVDACHVSDLTRCT